MNDRIALATTGASVAGATFAWLAQALIAFQILASIGAAMAAYASWQYYRERRRQLRQGRADDQP